jgi:hypothetical protein
MYIFKSLLSCISTDHINYHIEFSEFVTYSIRSRISKEKLMSASRMCTIHKLSRSFHIHIQHYERLTQLLIGCIVLLFVIVVEEEFSEAILVFRLN